MIDKHEFIKSKIEETDHIITKIKKTCITIEEFSEVTDYDGIYGPFWNDWTIALHDWLNALPDRLITRLTCWLFDSSFCFDGLGCGRMTIINF